MKPQTGRPIKNLRTIPGVGEKTAGYLLELGIRSVSCLKNKNPEKLYKRFCVIKGFTVDRCMLYVLRCAVYFASNRRHNKDLLKWWNWTDERMRVRKE